MHARADPGRQDPGGAVQGAGCRSGGEEVLFVGKPTTPLPEPEVFARTGAAGRCAGQR
jgi:hypothetical protein